MKRLFCAAIFLALLPSLSVRAEAPDPEAVMRTQANWQLFLANLVAYQPRYVGWKRFSEKLEMKTYLPGGKELSAAAKKVEEWPLLSMKGSVLKISGDGRTDSVELRGKEILVNGRPFKFQDNKLLLPQLQRAMEQETAGSFGLPFIPSAEAESAGVFMSSFLGHIVLGTVAIVGGATFGGAAGMAASVGILGGSLICLVSSSDPGADNSEYWKKYANCATTPLSALGINPRDRLYATELGCRDPKGISVALNSTSGHEETRTFFRNEKGQVNEIEIRGRDAKVRLQVADDGSRIESATTSAFAGDQGRLKRPGADKILDGAQKLLADYHAYEAICSDPEKIRSFRHRVGVTGSSDLRGYDDKTAEQMNKSAQ